LVANEWATNKVNFFDFQEIFLEIEERNLLYIEFISSEKEFRGGK